LSVASRTRIARGVLLSASILFVLVIVDAAVAQPFGINRGAPPPEIGGFAGWILAKQAEFYRMLSGLVRAAKADGRAAYTLLGVSFLSARHFIHGGWPLHHADPILVGAAAFLFLIAYAFKAWGWQRVFNEHERPGADALA
jgi:nickel/cobalt exporter